MNKNFLINFGILFLVNLIIKPAWIFSEIFVQRETGEDYGLYFVLVNLSFLFNIIIDAGINNYNNRKIAAVTGRFKVYFPNVFGLRIALSLAYILLLLLTGLSMGFAGNSILYLSILGANQILLGTILYVRSNLTALKHFKTDSFLSVTDRAIMITLLLISVFLMENQMTIGTFIGIQFIGYLITTIIAFLILYFKEKIILPKWNWRFSKKLLITSYPYAIIVILMSAYSYTDSLMMNQLLFDGNFQNMIYAQSFRLVMAVNNYAYLISVLLLPLFAGLIHKKLNAHPLLNTSGSLLIFGLTVVAIIGYNNSFEIIALLYGEFKSGVVINYAKINSSDILNIDDILYSQKVFQLFVLSVIPMGFNYTYGALLTANGSMKTLNYIALTGLIGNIVLNLVLIPTKGAIGAATASIFTQIFCGILQLLFTYKIFKLKINWVHFIKFSFGVLAIIIINNFLKGLIPWYHGILIISACAFPMIFLLKIITVKNIKSLLSIKQKIT